MAEFSADHAATLNQVLRYFVLPTDPSVPTFLSGHRSISQILLEAAFYLKVCFGAGAVFNLRAPIDEAGTASGDTQNRPVRVT